MPRHLRSCLLLAIGAVLLVPASASASTQIGQAFAPTAGPGQLFAFQTATFSDQPSYAVPSGGGVITSWSHISGLTPATLKFVVMRHVGSDYMVVDATDAKQLTVGGFLNTSDTRIPVLGGDVIGLRSSVLIADAKFPVNPGNTLLASSADPATGQFFAIISFAPYTSYALDVSAKVEPDGDGDGFGDESQDQCATDASTQGPCKQAAADTTAPAAALSSSTKQDVAKQGSVDVVVTSNEAGSASATGTLDIPGASKVFTLTPASANLAANAKTTLKLALSKKTKKALKKALRKGKKPTASVALTIKDTSGNATSVKQTIKVKGKKKKKKKKHGH